MYRFIRDILFVFNSLIDKLRTNGQAFENTITVGKPKHTLPILLYLFLITTSIHAQPLTAKSEMQPQWVILTEQAKKEINQHNFRKAYSLVQNAIQLNPSYAESKELYFSLYEILEREKSVARKKPTAETDIPIVSQTQQTRAPANNPEMAKNEPETQPAIQNKDVTIQSSGISLILYHPSIRSGILYTQTKSNYIDFLNSNTSMTGIRVETEFFLTRSNPSFGVSLDYSGSYKKMSGSEEILFTVHRLNAALPLRTTFFKERDRGLDLTFKPGLHYFILSNRKQYGAYYYRRILGPAAGLTVSDPVFSRIYHSAYTDPFGLEGIFNFVKLFGQSNTPSIIEYGAALTFDYGNYKIRSRYAQYTISNGSIIEKYSDTSLDIQLKF
jgi:hypothetical protein